MVAVRTLNIIAVLFVGFLLPLPHAVLGQQSGEAATLSQKVTELSKQGRYFEAIPLAQRALAIREKALGPDHIDVALSLYSLAGLYRVQGRYADAEPLFKRSLAI
jgi:tetratricopeptide (TPR) repeat protein